MTQITAPHTPRETTVRPEPVDHEPVRERLRSVLPVLLAVTMLFGVVLVGGHLLGDLLDFGVWFLAQP